MVKYYCWPCNKVYREDIHSTVDAPDCCILSQYALKVRSEAKVNVFSKTEVLPFSTTLMGALEKQNVSYFTTYVKLTSAYHLCGPSNCMWFCVLFRPGRGWTEGFSPQLSTVLPLPLGSGAAQRAAILPAHRPHGAGIGWHRCAGRKHEDPVLPRHLRTRHPAAE